MGSGSRDFCKQSYRKIGYWTYWFGVQWPPQFRWFQRSYYDGPILALHLGPLFIVRDVGPGEASGVERQAPAVLGEERRDEPVNASVAAPPATGSAE